MAIPLAISAAPPTLGLSLCLSFSLSLPLPPPCPLSRSWNDCPSCLPISSQLLCPSHSPTRLFLHLLSLFYLPSSSPTYINSTIIVSTSPSSPASTLSPSTAFLATFIYVLIISLSASFWASALRFDCYASHETVAAIPPTRTRTPTLPLSLSRPLKRQRLQGISRLGDMLSGRIRNGKCKWNRVGLGRRRDAEREKERKGRGREPTNG